MLLLRNDDVRSVLTMEDTMSALRQSYQELFAGEAVCRPNMVTNIPVGHPDRFFRWSTMEGGSAISGYFAMRVKNDIWCRNEYGEGCGKVVTDEWYSTTPGKYCGLIFLVKVENAELVAMIHDSHIQRSRVGADGAIGTDYMARKDAEILGILGSGGIARTQLAATMQVRKIRKVQVFSPTKDNRERFVREIADKYGIDAVALDNGRDVFRGAHIVAGCTDGGFADEENRAAIIGRWLEPGTHYTSIGNQGLVDSEAKRRTDVALRFGTAPAPVDLPQMGVPDGFVLYAVPATNPKFKEDVYYIANNSSRNRGPTAEDPAGNSVKGKTIQLKDLLMGTVEGRISDEQITFSERGNLQGAQFHAVAGRAYELARQRGVGQEIPTDWFLQDERN